ncbi:MAG: hypothetical protein KAS32_01730 [Candidatus Peribacteraceae bacterium]|nr:hypothetical protein [Candidatus Peribacteraceae bacterium]
MEYISEKFLSKIAKKIKKQITAPKRMDRLIRKLDKSKNIKDVKKAGDLKGDVRRVRDTRLLGGIAGASIVGVAADKIIEKKKRK